MPRGGLAMTAVGWVAVVGGLFAREPVVVFGGAAIMASGTFLPSRPEPSNPDSPYRFPDSARADAPPVDPWDKPYEAVAPTARANYLAGKITLEEFEGKVENALEGKLEVEPVKEETIDTPYGRIPASSWAARRRRVAQRRAEVTAANNARWTTAVAPEDTPDTGAPMASSAVAEHVRMYGRVLAEQKALADERFAAAYAAPPMVIHTDSDTPVGYVRDETIIPSPALQHYCLTLRRPVSGSSLNCPRCTAADDKIYHHCAAYGCSMPGSSCRHCSKWMA